MKRLTALAAPFLLVLSCGGPQKPQPIPAELQARLVESERSVAELRSANERLQRSSGAKGATAPVPASRLRAVDLFDFESVRDVRISPDGEAVAFVRYSADIKTDGRYSSIWVVGFDGSGLRPVTTGRHHDSSPRWSPDGTRLLFVSDREGSPQVYLVPLATGDAVRLTNLQEPPSGLAWSPDGKRISFTAFVRSEPPSLAQMPSAPEGAEWAEPLQTIDALRYRFNALGYLKPGYFHLFVMAAEPGTPRQVTSGDFHHGDPIFGGPAIWSRDGKSLIMPVNRREDHEYEPLDTELWEIGVDDGELRALTGRRGPDEQPAISPDGKQIAYVGFDDRYQGYQVARLHLMNRDGSGSRVLTAKLDRSVRSPVWADDGRGIFFAYDDQGNGKLGFVTLAGEVEVVARDLGASTKAYGWPEFTAGGQGRFAFSRTRPDAFGQVAVGARSGSARSARVVVDLNRDLFAAKTLSTVEEIWFASSKDQRKIHGWLMKPPGFDPKKKYPLILEIHGGPFANYGGRFDLEKQIWAAHDYLVLYINPRGSTSYGEEFGNLIHHAYPGDDYFDLISGVDAVIAKGFVDESRLYVTGGSGGGVLTCWIIGKTKRFRAAATAYPVINWYSMVLTTDLPVFIGRYWFPGMPWEEPEHYLARSPLSLVGEVETPTLVITGENDFRTPISESEQYYQALKLRKVESALVRAPDEAHGIAGRPSHHIAKLLSILGWFEKHASR